MKKKHVYRQVGAARDAYEGRKAWIPPEAQKSGKACNPSDLTLGSIGPRSFQDIAGMESAMLLARFSTNLHPK